MQGIKDFIADYCRNEFLKDDCRHCKFLELKSTTAANYQVGYVPSEGLLAILDRAGYSGTEISALNLSASSNKYCFPSRSSTGEIVAFYFRRSDMESQPIWKYQIYDKNSFYGMDKLSNEREYIILCEGVRDVLACASNGISNVVAVTNRDFPTSEQIEILRSYKNILVAFDNDARGEKFADIYVNLLADTDFAITPLQYNGSDIRIALRDLTQRRLIINQIKTVLARIKE